MKIDPTQWEWMEAYVEGKLSEADRKHFEESYSQDNELQEALKDFRAMKAGIEKLGQVQMRKKIAAWETEAANQKGAHTKFVLFKWAAAILLVVAGTWIAHQYLSHREAQPEPSLAESLFSPYPSLRAERSDGQQSLMDSLLFLYDSGDFAGAAKGFSYLERPASEAPDTWDFYLAESLISSGNYIKGADILSAFQDRSHAFYETARFHRALALVMAGEGEEAEDVLTMIAMEKGPFREKALAVLEDLTR